MTRRACLACAPTPSTLPPGLRPQTRCDRSVTRLLGWSEQRELDLDVPPDRIRVRAALLSLGDQRLGLLAIGDRGKGDEQFHVEPEPPVGDPSKTDSGGDDGVLDIEALASCDADHRVLPARDKAESEELFRVGAGTAIATQLGGRAEVDLDLAVRSCAVAPPSASDRRLRRVEHRWQVRGLTHQAVT